jgi:hypothetical protein
VAICARRCRGVRPSTVRAKCTWHRCQSTPWKDRWAAFTPLDVPGAGRTTAFGINAAGTIVVGQYAASSAAHGFVRPE